MKIKFICESCGKKYSVESKFAGKKLKCKNEKCASPMQVPKLKICPDCDSAVNERAYVCSICGFDFNKDEVYKKRKQDEVEKENKIDSEEQFETKKICLKCGAELSFLDVTCPKCGLGLLTGSKPPVIKKRETCASPMQVPKIEDNKPEKPEKVNKWKICPDCDSAINERAYVCSICGFDFNKDEVSTRTKRYSERELENAVYRAVDRHSRKIKTEKSHKELIGILIIVISLAFLAIGNIIKTNDDYCLTRLEKQHQNIEWYVTLAICGIALPIICILMSKKR